MSHNNFSTTDRSNYNGKFKEQLAKEDARTEAISRHPAAKTHPVIMRALLSATSIELSDAIGALDQLSTEAVRTESSDAPAATDEVTPFQKMNAKLDEHYGPTENTGRAA